MSHVYVVNESGDKIITVNTIPHRLIYPYVAAGGNGFALQFQHAGSDDLLTWYAIRTPTVSYPYIVTLLDAFEQYPIQSGRVVVSSSEVFTNASGITEFSGLASGAHTLVVSAPRCSKISISKAVDDSATGATTIYISRAMSDCGCGV